MGGQVTTDRGTTLNFTLSSETWTIAAGVRVWSSSYAVFSDQWLSTLNNNGHIFTTSSGGGGGDDGGGPVAPAVYFTGASAVINNNAGARIEGYINFEGDGLTLMNAGTITGLSSHEGKNIVVTNKAGGTIEGGLSFWSWAYISHQATITNEGQILGGVSNWGDSGGAGRDCQITNKAGGLIKGGVDGIVSNGARTTIVNHGTVIGEGSAGNGVELARSAGGSVLNNFGTGSIRGDGNGVLLWGSNQTVNNSGTIEGVTGAGVRFSNDLFFQNGTLNNSGTVKGQIGVLLDADLEQATVNNGTKGKIDGETYAIYVAHGQISVTNKGTIDGNIFCGGSGANDKIVNLGLIQGDVTFVFGDNIFNGKGGTVTGAIRGGSGKDILTGGKGGDTLWGGPGSDTFTFVNAKETGKGARADHVMDFAGVEGDKIDLRRIDANTLKKGDQKFKFIGGSKFHKKAGELHVIDKGSGLFFVEGDVNGDGKADFQIQVKAVSDLMKEDFLL